MSSSFSSPHLAATLALEAYRTRLGAVLAFIDDAASARIQLPTDVIEMTATLDGLLEYFLAGEAAFTATGPALAAHTARVEELAAAVAELEREELTSAVLAQQLHILTGAADNGISLLVDASDSLAAAANSSASRQLPCMSDETRQWTMRRASMHLLSEGRRPRRCAAGGRAV